jgi:Bacterial surface proteins containing Ig-like domains
MLSAILIFYGVLGFYTQVHALVISLNETRAILTTGDYDYLYASVYSYESVTWTSSNPNVATVSSFGSASGCVEAVSAGTATITATTAGGNRLSCVVTVNNPVSVPSISLNKIGDYDYLSAPVFPYRAVTWTSSNPNVATVSSFGSASGCVKAVSSGMATITATTAGGNKIASYVVIVNSQALNKRALNKAISAAQAVLNNSSATQSDIDNAVTTLKQALQLLL